MPAKPTLPAERTRLAWQRTTLAGMICLLVALRLLVEVSVPLVAVAGIVLLVAVVFGMGVAIRRAVRRRGLTTETAVGRNAAMLTAVVCSAFLAVIAYLLFG